MNEAALFVDWFDTLPFLGGEVGKSNKVDGKKARALGGSKWELQCIEMV